MNWAQIYRANRPYPRRVLMWRLLGAIFLMMGLVIARGIDLRQWRSLVGLALGVIVCAGAGWMFWRAHQIGSSNLSVVRGSITEMIPGDYDLSSSFVMHISSAFSFGGDGVTTPLSNRLGQQRLGVPDYAVFTALGEGKTNMADVQFLCRPDGSVISLLDDALRQI
jgi:hypothetical protein